MLGQLMESKEFFPANVANLVNYVHVEIVAPVVIPCKEKKKIKWINKDCLILNPLRWF